MPLNLATADIGSNTVHLLVAQADQGKIRRLANESEWLSLGKTVKQHGHIPPETVTEIVSILGRFKQVSKDLKAEALYVFGTEALRRAKNIGSVLKKVEKCTGISVDLVSPETESDLGSEGTRLDTAPECPFLFAECGGGSVQLAWVKESGVEDHASMPLGTGVLLAGCGLEQPATENQLARLGSIVRQETKVPWPKSQLRDMVASGGVARGILRALHPDGEKRIDRREIEYLEWDCRRLTVPLICARYNVKPNRAMTFVPGCAVFIRVMELAGLQAMTVSEFGVREGAIARMHAGKIKAKRL